MTRTSTQRARYEQLIARAHANLWRAQLFADELDDPGAALDLQEMMQHLVALQESSLKGKRIRVRDDATGSAGRGP